MVGDSADSAGARHDSWLPGWALRQPAKPPPPDTHTRGPLAFSVTAQRGRVKLFLFYVPVLEMQVTAFLLSLSLCFPFLYSLPISFLRCFNLSMRPLRSKLSGSKHESEMLPLPLTLKRWACERRGSPQSVPHVPRSRETGREAHCRAEGSLWVHGALSTTNAPSTDTFLSPRGTTLPRIKHQKSVNQ